MSFPKKLILAAGLLLIFTIQAAQSLQCYECAGDGKCDKPPLITCKEEDVATTAATPAAARAYYDDSYPESDPGDHQPEAFPPIEKGEVHAVETEPPGVATASEKASPAEGGASEAAPSVEGFIQHLDDVTPEGGTAAAVGGSVTWFCATLKGELNKTSVTYKGCSSKENDCESIKPLVDFKQGSCKTCKKDKCNSGFNVKPITLPVLLVVVMLFISVYY